jgi:NADH-quinone oxidoreductase subunit M
MLEPFFPPADRELDLLQLSLLVFLPAGFALLLLVWPGRFREGMRWFALFGAAGTLAVSLCTLIDYHRLLDSQSDRATRSLYHPGTRLDSRADEALARTATNRSFLSDDLVARRPWVSKFDVDYALGVDGISLALVILTALVTFFAIIASWKIEENLRGYLILLLVLESGVLGAFLSLDLFLFYVFYEVMLLPMYFLIGLWGGQRRKYAAIKFVIYTLVGSVGLLVAIIALYSVDVRDFVPQEMAQAKARQVKHDHAHLSPEEVNAKAEIHTFDSNTLSKVGRAVMLVLSGPEERLTSTDPKADPVPLFAPGVDRAAALARLKSQPVCTPTFQYILFALLFLGFAVKVPIVPLHSWLPDAHVEAPTPISMILAGVLLKLGGYGLIRFAFPICPWAADQLAWYVGLIGVIGIVYGALVAMGQTDFKRMLAYSSVSHMGYVVLGLASWSGGARSEYWQWGVNGALFQMISHGITSAALFFVVGVIYDRAHHRDLDRFGGLKEPMPVYSGLSAILFFASMGLPGLCGFVGEFQVMMAAWNYCWFLGTLSILATILTAGYLLWAWQRVFLGVNPATAKFPDVSGREATVLIPLALLCILLGVIPGLVVFQWTEPAVNGWIDNLAKLKR